MSPARRGAPLMFLGAVVAGWIVARAVTYVPLWADSPAQAQLASSAKPLDAKTSPTVPGRSAALAVPATHPLALGISHKGATWRRPSRQPRPGAPAFGHSASSDLSSIGPADAALQAPGPTSRPLGVASIWQPEPTARNASSQPSRWSGDAWLLWRRDTAAPLIFGEPGYGRSQAGAVLRYSLAPGSGHRPQAYLRASAALSGPRERDLAAGLSVRPLAGVPLRLAAEGRVSETVGGTELRPAVFAVSEFPPAKLPFGAQGELYVQGGYVGGRFATAFVDGQARVDRPIAEAGDLALRVGAGVWGGAQEGASRLDVGPTAAVSFRLGDVRGRLAADYRFRIAGEAEPASGPALTVSAGF